MPHNVDALIERYGVDQVIEAVRPLLSERRMERIEQVLDARLSSLTVVLENLHDPHNGAATIRSVEAFGLTSVHVVETMERFRHAPAVTIGSEKWIDTHRYASFTECAVALRERGMLLYATVPGAELTLDSIDVSRPCAVVFGNEHEGLTAEAIEACDHRVSIPMFGFTQSFNLSVSVALSVQRLSERRRRHLGATGDLDRQERARLRARWYAQSVRAAEQIVERSVSN
jgi:tRNA (guanosine-2'-O-)-methyltransferase